MPGGQEQEDDVIGDFGGRSNGSVPRVRLRTFNGNPEEYKEWRREVQASTLLYNVAPKQMAGLVYLALAKGLAQPYGHPVHHGRRRIKHGLEDFGQGVRA